MTPEIALEIERLRGVLAAIGLPLTLQPPASVEEISQFEVETGVRFDGHLRAFWEATNGSNRNCWIALSSDEDDVDDPENFTPCAFMSLAETRETWARFSPYDQAFYDRWRWDKYEVNARDRRIQPVFLHHKLWIPIVDSPGGSTVVYFDSDPAPDGRYGQVIKYEHDPDAIDYVAESFLELFQRSNRILAKLAQEEDCVEVLREWLDR